MSLGFLNTGPVRDIRSGFLCRVARGISDATKIALRLKTWELCVFQAIYISLNLESMSKPEHSRREVARIPSRASCSQVGPF